MQLLRFMLHRFFFSSLLSFTRSWVSVRRRKKRVSSLSSAVFVANNNILASADGKRRRALHSRVAPRIKLRSQEELAELMTGKRRRLGFLFFLFFSRASRPSRVRSRPQKRIYAYLIEEQSNPRYNPHTHARA